jgi:pyruvate/2-oxoglutarate dehydrogenase complex dihydrolipoamide dehydrogenase (E3) component
LLFGDTWQVSRLVAHVPRCCYTEPQLAAVGLTKAEAAASGIAIDTYVSSLEHNDRVILEGQVRCLPLIATDCH